MCRWFIFFLIYFFPFSLTIVNFLANSYLPTYHKRKCLLKRILTNRPFSYSGKESEWNGVMIQFEEVSNEHNSDRTSNAT